MRLLSLGPGILVAFAVSCGGTTTASSPDASCTQGPLTSLDGGLTVAVDAMRLELRSAAAVAQIDLPAAAIVFSETDDACRELLDAGNAERRNFVLTIPVNATGTFPIAASPNDTQAAARIDHVCGGGSSSIYASGGTVTVDAYQPPSAVSGSYDLTFASGETLSGSFRTCFCTSQQPCATSVP